jgi:DNA topoisomerase-1
VIQKLVTRKYVEGNPLRPTLVGRAVIQSLEDHAATVTEPDMTRTLEEHMQQIKERKRDRDHVVTESRQMLHKAFDQLEAHEQEIGDEIREMTAEELSIGKCPACGGTLRIRHMKGSSQFIGCTGYPGCSFNIGLPVMQWGLAVRTDTVCRDHHLHNIRLVRKRARPWELGCPLCRHITAGRETLALIAGMTDAMIARLNAGHTYTVQDVVKMAPAVLAGILGTTEEAAGMIIRDAEGVLALLRRRSECKKFVREHLVPKKGRSSALVMKNLHSAGINDIPGLAAAGQAALQKAGMSEKEAQALVREATAESAEKRLKETGITAASLKKYRAAGFSHPGEICATHPLTVSERTGLSVDAVQRHMAKICGTIGRPASEKLSKAQLEKGRAELAKIPGIGEWVLGRLYHAGVCDRAALANADVKALAALTGIPEKKLDEYQSHVILKI